MPNERMLGIVTPLRWTATLVIIALAASAQTPNGSAAKPTAPAWAQPGSATHTQVAPPADYHQPTKTFNTPIGIFEAQSDVGGPLLPGSASYDQKTHQYTVSSAGYNIWYTRDEFRFLWKKMSGDVSLAADVSFPDPTGYNDRKAVLIIRQDLDDDSKEVLIGYHGAGMIQLAQRPDKAVRITDMEYRIAGRGRPGGATPDSLVTISPKRVGLEKRGDEFAIFMSLDGEPMQQFGPPIRVHMNGPFYVGIGFCSHVPEKSDSAVLSDVVLENAAGKVR